MGVRLQREGQDFALDNQMELVFVPFDYVRHGLPAPPPVPLETGAAWLNGVADDREKNGTDRLIEALQCNMWAKMKMKPKPQDLARTTKRDTEKAAETKRSTDKAATTVPPVATSATTTKVCDSCNSTEPTIRCDPCEGMTCTNRIDPGLIDCVACVHSQSV
jgi:hypothetical protein